MSKNLLLVLVLFMAAQLQAEMRPELLEPLAEHERLAYKMKETVLQLYAQELDNQENVRLIGEWGPVREKDVLFTNDRRNCFFLIHRPPYFTQGSLFEYSGGTGEVTHILEVAYPFRISRDGKFLVFSLLSMYDSHHSVAFWQGKCIVALWSIKPAELIDTFEWTVKKNWRGGFRILMDKDDGIINIYHTLEGGYFPAHAVIDLRTKELRVLRDITDDIVWGKTSVPEITDTEYQYDDVINQQKDATLRLNGP